MSVAGPISHEQKLIDAGIIEPPPKAKPSPLPVTDPREDEMTDDILEVVDPEALARRNANRLAWAQRLDDKLAGYYRAWGERHADMPANLKESALYLYVETLSKRGPEFFDTVSGDWNVPSLEAEADKITKFVCEQAGWTPRQSEEEYVNFRNRQNPSRSSSILARLEKRGKQ